MTTRKEKFDIDVKDSSDEYLEYLRTLKQALDISEGRYKTLVKKFHDFMENVKNSVVKKNRKIEELTEDIKKKNTIIEDLQSDTRKNAEKVKELEKKLILKEIEIDELKLRKNSEKIHEEKKSLTEIAKKTVSSSEDQLTKGDDFIYLGKKK